MRDLIAILALSVQKHGDKPLTTKYLLNILKMAENRRLARATREAKFLNTLDTLADPNQ